VASVLYLYLSILQYQYERMVRDYPITVLAADDDVTWTEYNGDYEDDYVLQAPLTKRWISEYTVVYFSAAMCFLIAGIVDWYQWRDYCFSGLMIGAAGFGLASACYGETNVTLSKQLNVVSVHLWLVDAVVLLCTTNRRRYGPVRSIFQPVLRIAALFLVVATVLDVVLSWLYLVSVWRHHPADIKLRVGIPLTITEIIAAAFWLIAAILYVTVTLI
jgi:hypothetical protein